MLTLCLFFIYGKTQKVASEAGFNSSKVRSNREHMLGVLILSGGTWLVVAGCSWAYVGVKHQVPYMAR